MRLKDIVAELETQGFEIEYRVRSDGGIVITKINGVSFKGTAGNTQARQIAGVPLSTAQINQRQQNIKNYIQGSKKPKKKLDDKLKKEIRKTQRIWKKNGVKGKVTTRKVREHIKREGRKAALEYLQRMQRYGQGYAYEDNVYWLATYTYNVAEGLETNGATNAAAKYRALAEYILAHTDTFKEAWIKAIYNYLYEVRNNGYNGAIALNLLPQIYSIMK